jgi:hypothetical protein
MMKRSLDTSNWNSAVNSSSCNRCDIHLQLQDRSWRIIDKRRCGRNRFSCSCGRRWERGRSCPRRGHSRGRRRPVWRRSRSRRRRRRCRQTPSNCCAAGIAKWRGCVRSCGPRTNGWTRRSSRSARRPPAPSWRNARLARNVLRISFAASWQRLARSGVDWRASWQSMPRNWRRFALAVDLSSQRMASLDLGLDLGLELELGMEVEAD